MEKEERRVDLQGIIFGLHGKPMSWSKTDIKRVEHCMRMAIEQILEIAKYELLLDNADVALLMERVGDK